MIVAIAPDGVGEVKVEEFRSAVSVAEAITAFCNSYDPALDPEDYVGLDVGSYVPVQPKGGWYYSHTTQTLVESLVEAKKAKFAEVDARTDELIASGFTFASKQFSLSQNAQSRLMGINQVRDDENVVYPIKWNTIDDSDTYSIPDSATVLGFYLTAVGTYRTHVDSGTTLKDQVRAATTIAEVNAVVDNR